MKNCCNVGHPPCYTIPPKLQSHLAAHTQIYKKNRKLFAYVKYLL